MAQPYCTGAIHAFAGVGTDDGKEPLYLGTTESLPGIDTARGFDAVMNDISGSRDPFDYIYEGPGEGLVSLVLTRWNEATLQNMDAIAVTVAGFGGSCNINDMGALMAQEGRTFPLWLLFQFGSQLANKITAYPGQPGGRFYPQCLVWGPDRLEGGTRAKKQHRIIKAYREYDPDTGNFVLYSELDSFLTGLPPLE